MQLALNENTALVLLISMVLLLINWAWQLAPKKLN